MKEWQRKIFDEAMKGGITKGQIFFVGASRRTGKSHMTAKMMEKFFADRAAREWTEWNSAWCWFPRRSWYGKWIIGRMYERSRWEEVEEAGDMSGHTFTRMVRKRQYVSEKELFKWKLKYGSQG